MGVGGRLACTQCVRDKEVRAVMTMNSNTQIAADKLGNGGFFSDFSQGKVSEVGKYAQRVIIAEPERSLLSKCLGLAGKLSLKVVELFKSAFLGEEEDPRATGLVTVRSKANHDESHAEIARMPKVGPILLFLAVVIFAIAFCSKIQIPL